MKIQSILLFLILISVQCESSTTWVSSDTCCINLEFDGFSGQFYQKYDIYLKIESIEKNKTLLDQIGRLEKTGWINTRMVVWKIKIYDSVGNRICYLLQLESGEYVFKNTGSFFDNSLYKNDVLFNYLLEEMKVQRIKAFPGKVTQEIYDEIILK